jgi:MFS family permease
MMTLATNSGVEAPAGAPGSAQEATSARAWYALVVLIVAMLFGAIDRQILVLMIAPIKHDLSLSDLQIGEINGLGPLLFSALVTFPLAWLADRTERRTVLCACVIFWSIGTAACGLATNFASLFSCTVSIAIGEAALTPIVYSLIPDLFPERARPRANIICYAAAALGAGVGFAFGGGLLGVVAALRPVLPSSLNTLETWRLAFILVSLPGPLVALAVFLIGRTRHVVMAAQDAAPAVPMRIGPYMRRHGGVVVGVYGSMACFSFALLAVGSWLPVALIRTFHAAPASVGVNYGLIFMAGAVVGMLAATAITPYWRRIAGTALVLRAITFAAAGAAVPAFLLGFAANIWQAYALFFCLSAIFVSGTSLMPGMMQDIAPPALRSRVIAVGFVGVAAVGAISPALVGFISDRVSSNPRGLMWAIAATAPAGFLVCAALSRLLEGPYRRTVAAVAAGD